MVHAAKHRCYHDATTTSLSAVNEIAFESVWTRCAANHVLLRCCVVQVMGKGQRRQSVRMPLSRHHKRNMEAEEVVNEHTGDADVVIELG